MSYTVKNFISDKPNMDIKVTQAKGCFAVAEYLRDFSTRPSLAVAAYYSAEMDIRKRQLVVDLSDAPHGVTLQAGAMQWMLGKVAMSSGIKGVGDMAGKMFKGKVTGESASKPEYKGNGIVVCEPTYRHLIIMDAAEWPGGVVLEDGLFMACETSLKQTVISRRSLGAAVAGGEGLFNLKLSGKGIFVVESRCPKTELIEIELKDDVIKIDGNYAVAWSDALEFTVERSSKSLLGSAASGEGLVNVYRGTGRILMEPLAKMPDV